MKSIYNYYIITNVKLNKGDTWKFSKFSDRWLRDDEFSDELLFI